MTSNTILASYQHIWNKYNSSTFKPLLDRGFVFQFDEDETDCELLFIGINPANKDDGNSLIGPYKRQNESDEKILAYFKPFVFISKELNETYKWKGQWTHLDVFAFRETNQKYIETELLRKDNKEGIAFLFEQLMVAKKRILHIKPKVIVVSNALVRMFMGKQRFEDEHGKEYGVWMGFRFEFDHEIGTDVIVEPTELKGTHVFFTSMLSGQRALDNGSKERLVWHVARVLNGYK
jgi:hypothetical protein